MSKGKVRIRYYSGKMELLVCPILPKDFAFECKSIESPTARIVCASDNLAFRCLALNAQIVYAKSIASRCYIKIVTSKVCVNIAQINVDAESIVSRIQDFRGSDIDKARRWWYRNKARLIDLLPLTWKGITYTTRFPEKFEEWLYSDKLNPMLREIYVFRRIHKVQQAMRSFLGNTP